MVHVQLTAQWIEKKKKKNHQETKSTELKRIAAQLAVSGKTEWDKNSTKNYCVFVWMVWRWINWHTNTTKRIRNSTHTLAYGMERCHIFQAIGLHVNSNGNVITNVKIYFFGSSTRQKFHFSLLRIYRNCWIFLCNLNASKRKIVQRNLNASTYSLSNGLSQLVCVHECMWLPFFMCSFEWCVSVSVLFSIKVCQRDATACVAMPCRNNLLSMDCVSAAYVCAKF